MLNHLVCSKLKSKKLYFRQYYVTRKVNLQGDCLVFVHKGSGSGFFPDPGDPKRPDPDPQHWYCCMYDSLSLLCSRHGHFRLG